MSDKMVFSMNDLREVDAVLGSSGKRVCSKLDEMSLVNEGRVYRKAKGK